MDEVIWRGVDEDADLTLVAIPGANASERTTWLRQYDMNNELVSECSLIDPANARSLAEALVRWAAEKDAAVAQHT